MKRTPLIRRTPLKRSWKRPWRRKEADKVPDWLPGYLMGRDKGCVPHNHLRAPGECSGRLTIEHVKFESMMGKRAPSDQYHTLLACYGANTGWCLFAASKELERAYLRRVEPKCYSGCGCAGARDYEECEFDPSCGRCAA